MSAPNKDFDPVAVTPLSAEQVDAAVAAALAAFASAQDLDQLKAARLAHAGDRSPIALANREIGALPPAAKAEAGARIGKARNAIKEALEAREVVAKHGGLQMTAGQRGVLAAMRKPLVGSDQT
mgnify:CR=1 FL=1